ncbi:uncharacterized protein LOC143274174 [Peromyscus maniculatus bairdii]|uniref:uncharacterized protein LOC143274174 n=1 Tax=Peromyscus maniculatus bairdii TaxID=230844 RepID=UPI003FD541BD
MIIVSSPSRKSSTDTLMCQKMNPQQSGRCLPSENRRQSDLKNRELCVLSVDGERSSLFHSWFPQGRVSLELYKFLNVQLSSPKVLTYLVLLDRSSCALMWLAQRNPCRVLCCCCPTWKSRLLHADADFQCSITNPQVVRAGLCPSVRKQCMLSIKHCREESEDQKDGRPHCSSLRVICDSPHQGGLTTDHTACL